MSNFWHPQADVVSWDYAMNEAGGDPRFSHYSATMVPWTWLLTKTADSRIFQEVSVPDIVEKIFTEKGFSDFSMRVHAGYEKRKYCVQYRETDFNFISRLLHSEGRYFHYQHESDRSVLILCDNGDCHDPVPGNSDFEYMEANAVGEGSVDCIFDWDSYATKRTSDFATTDYDFTKINADLAASVSIINTAGTPSESYTYPGGYTEVPEGERLLALKSDATDTASVRVTGRTNAMEFRIAGTSTGVSEK